MFKNGQKCFKAFEKMPKTDLIAPTMFEIFQTV